MTPEDRLRRLLHEAGDRTEARPPGWSEFVPVAHRHLRVRRAALAGAGVALLAGIAVAAAALGLGPAPTPPANGGIGTPGPSGSPSTSPSLSGGIVACPPAPDVGPTGFGRYGALAYLRGRTLYLQNLGDTGTSSGPAEALAHRLPTGNDQSGDLTFSPDGSWISLGDGSMVSSGSGTKCSPVPEGDGRIEWIPGGDDAFVEPTTRGGLVYGTPQGAGRVLLPNGWGVTGALPDPSGRYVAVTRSTGSAATPSTGVYVLDLSSGSSTRVARYEPKGGSAIEPRLASWSPDSAWILFWTPTNSASLAADGGPLQAVPRGGSATGTTQVLSGMVMDPNLLSWCGDDLVATSGLGRELGQGKELVGAHPPDWRPVPLPGQPKGSVFAPSCSADGSWVAATVVAPGYGGNPMSPADGIAVMKAAGSAPTGFDAGTYASEYPRMSPEPVPGESWVLLFVGHGPGGRNAKVYLEQGESIRPVADLGSVGFGYYGLYDYSKVFDWWMPGG